MSDQPRKFYLTTPIYYVNARPHIGHAYTTIVADVLARRHRLLGDDTFFLTGTDEHGQKIERSAAAAGIPPQHFADEVSESFQKLWDRMGLTYNKFIRTTHPKHKRGAQKLFSELYDRGFIYLDSYTGQYSIGEEMFVDGPPGTIGPDGKPTETVTEENFFFKLSEFQLPLLNLIESNQLLITPDTARNEVLSFLRGNTLPEPTKRPRLSEAGPDATLMTNEGSMKCHIAAAIEEGEIALSAADTPYVPGALRDISVSRSSFTWGIPVPEAIQQAAGATQKHVIYVWLDALANYITAIGYGSDDPKDHAEFKKWWPADLHLVGKEITRFHCIYWPAFLLALNPKLQHKPDQPAPILTPEEHAEWAREWLPKQITANGWLLFDNAKMSKSRGNVVRTETILDAFGTLCPPTTVAHSNSGPNQDSVILSAASRLHREAESKDPENASPADTDAAAENSVILSAASQPHREAEPKDPEAASATSTASGFSTEIPQTSTKTDRDLFAADVLRYFLLREIPFGQDGSFSFDAMITRYNADLANGYGNLVNRSLHMISIYNAGLVESEDRQYWTEENWFQYAFGMSPGITRWSAADEPSPEATSFRKYSIFQTIQHATRAREVAGQRLGKVGLQSQLAEIALAIQMTDGFISSESPWKLAKQSESKGWLNEILYTAAESIRIITALLYPILPFATASVWRQLGLGSIEQAARNGELKNLEWGGLKTGTKLGPLSPIFPRADKGLAQIMIDMENERSASTPSPSTNAAASTSSPAAPPRSGTSDEPVSPLTVGGSSSETPSLPTTPEGSANAPASGPFASAASQSSVAANTADASPQITIDDFAKVELRVGQIVLAERIPKADKLLRLEVDLGPAFGPAKRQILSGIAEWYTPEELIGRRIVVITNLAPRKMRGLESHGMLLAASAPASDSADGKPGKPILATMAEDIALGSRLK